MHEIQFNFNFEIEDSITSAKKELTKVIPIDQPDKESTMKAGSLLDKGLKIREVAETYKSGWPGGLPLKCLEKEAERAANKHWHGGSATGIKKKSGSGGAGPKGTALLLQAPARPPRIPVLGGPVGTVGNLATWRRCVKTVYPLKQLVVSKAETPK